MGIALKALMAFVRWFDGIEVKFSRRYQFYYYQFRHYTIPAKGLWRNLVVNALGLVAWADILMRNAPSIWTTPLIIFIMAINGTCLWRFAHLTFLQRTGTCLPIGNLVEQSAAASAEDICMVAKRKRIPVRIIVRNEKAEAWFRNDDEAVLIRMMV